MDTTNATLMHVIQARSATSTPGARFARAFFLRQYKREAPSESVVIEDRGNWYITQHPAHPVGAATHLLAVEGRAAACAFPHRAPPPSSQRGRMNSGHGLPAGSRPLHDRSSAGPTHNRHPPTNPSRPSPSGLPRVVTALYVQRRFSNAQERERCGAGPVAAARLWQWVGRWRCRCSGVSGAAARRVTWQAADV